jgi:hypothetical protein
VKKADIEKAFPVISDIVYQRMRQVSISTLRKPEAMPWLRRQLVSDINFSLLQMGVGKDHTAEEPKEDTKKKKKKGKRDEEAEEPLTAPNLTEMPKLKDLKHPELDAEEGPIVKIFFQSFATQ